MVTHRTIENLLRDRSKKTETLVRGQPGKCIEGGRRRAAREKAGRPRIAELIFGRKAARIS